MIRCVQLTKSSVRSVYMQNRVISQTSKAQVPPGKKMTVTALRFKKEMSQRSVLWRFFFLFYCAQWGLKNKDIVVHPTG